MSAFTSIRRKIAIRLNRIPNDNWIKRILYLINDVLFHWDERCHQIHPGSADPETTYYVIRPSGMTEGLLSVYFGVIGKISYALENGWVPYVDFENYKWQYSVDREVNGTFNGWEYYFKQPSSVTKEQLSNARNVILTGWSVKKNPSDVRFSFQPPIASDVKAHVLGLANVREYLWEDAKRKYDEIKIDEHTLGLFLRGTDYVKIKPRGHRVQPTLGQAYVVIDDFLKRYPIKQIFIVTEDSEIFQRVSERYGGGGYRVFCSDYVFVDNYSSSDWVQGAFKDDPYERGYRYLLRLLLLSKCDYLVSGVASGSEFADLIRREPRKAEYFFNLGYYGDETG